MPGTRSLCTAPEGVATAVQAYPGELPISYHRVQRSCALAIAWFKVILYAQVKGQ